MHHLVGILLRHLDIADTVEQIDMSHFLTALDIAVEELHYLSRIEAVGLAEIDEEFLVSRLRLVGLALAAFATLAGRAFLAVATA